MGGDPLGRHHTHTIGEFMDAYEILKYFTSIGVGSGVIAYLIKSLTGHFMYMDIEKYKIDLQTHHKIEIERLKADLRQVAFERELRYSKLHEMRFEAVADLFRKMVNAKCALHMRLADIKTDRQMHEIGLENKLPHTDPKMPALLDFAQCLVHYTIYLDDNMRNDLHKVSDKMFSLMALLNASDTPGLTEEDRFVHIESSANTTLNELTMLELRIEKLARHLLGIANIDA